MSPAQLDTMRARIIAGTGHRPDKLGGYSPAATKRLQGFAEFVLDLARPRGVITGMALGWDQALANAAARCGIPYVAAVPFKGQESRWPFFSRQEYDLLLRNARKVVYVCEPGYAAWKMQRRNEWMVDQCDVLFAVWNGTDGGTANCVRYAEKQGRPVVNAWQDFELRA